MIYQNVELHNIAEVFKDEKYPEAVGMQRVPESVRRHLNERAREIVRYPASAEIRFLADGPVKVTLSTKLGELLVMPFFGDFQCAAPYRIGTEPQTLEIAGPDRFEKVPAELLKDLPFSPDVRRLLLYGVPALLHGIEGEGVRPPRPDEVPKLTYLAYGTSITHGGCATGGQLSYASQVARRLNANLLNLGMGGACHCEYELADYIAGRDDWDFATLSLSVNMIGARFTLEEFHKRVKYMVEQVAGKNPGKPVFCITIFPHFRDMAGGAFDADPPLAEAEEYREAYRRAVRELNLPNVTLVEGPEILTSIAGLTPDLIHPSDNGMIMMGENLARMMKPVISKLSC